MEVWWKCLSDTVSPLRFKTLDNVLFKSSLLQQLQYFYITNVTVSFYLSWIHPSLPNNKQKSEEVNVKKYLETCKTAVT